MTRYDATMTALKDNGFTECCNEFIAYTEGYPDACSNCGRRVVYLWAARIEVVR